MNAISGIMDLFELPFTMLTQLMGADTPPTPGGEDASFGAHDGYDFSGEEEDPCNPSPCSGSDNTSGVLAMIASQSGGCNPSPCGFGGGSPTSCAAAPGGNGASCAAAGGSGSACGASAQPGTGGLPTPDSGTGSQAQWGKPLDSSLAMPVKILENVVLTDGNIQGQDKDAIKGAITNIQKGENLNCAINGLNPNQRTELEGAIAGAGFRPPDCLEQYSKDPSKDYSPGRLDCALCNVQVAEQCGEQNTQAYKLEHMVPFFGPLVTNLLNMGLGLTANLEGGGGGL